VVIVQATQAQPGPPRGPQAPRGKRARWELRRHPPCPAAPADVVLGALLELVGRGKTITYRAVAGLCDLPNSSVRLRLRSASFRQRLVAMGRLDLLAALDAHAAASRATFEGRRGVRDFEGPAPPPAAPCQHQPGTPEKLAVLCQRARAGQDLWHKEDGPSPQRPGCPDPDPLAALAKVLAGLAWVEDEDGLCWTSPG
jgi:hypothetical protein